VSPPQVRMACECGTSWRCTDASGKRSCRDLGRRSLSATSPGSPGMDLATCWRSLRASTWAFCAVSLTALGGLWTRPSSWT
ncbi:unnamed protein product, partial [Symbiodinium microadriaticum]